MPRIEIELTSSRPDGSWTWRAAGARQPKGSLDGSILPTGLKVGDVVRADVEVELDGMTVTAVLPPKSKRDAGGRLEILGPPGRERDVPGVTASPGVSLTGEDGDRRRRGGPPGARGPNGGRERDRPASGRPGAPRSEGPRTGRPGGPGGPSAGGPPGGGRPGRHTGDRAPGGRPPGDRVASGRPSPGPRGSERSGPPRERAPRPAAAAPPPRPRPKRLNPGRAHRDSVLASLPPEELPVAEQILRGGVPAVRQALDEQNAAARAAGAPEVRADALLALAERLAPRLRAAEWLDRAEAAVAQAEEVSLRDLRALVAGSDAVGRDESGRELAGRLRQVLDDRSAKERDMWLGEITEALDAGRVVRALRASGRPPEPGVRFPAPLAERLSEAANVAMAADVAPDRWAAVLDAVTSSPVRRLVKPPGLPAEAPPELVQAARQAAERVPGLVPLVGAPEPSARPAKRVPARPAGRGPGGPGPARRRPPLPPRPAAAVPPPPPPRQAQGAPPSAETSPVPPPPEAESAPPAPAEAASAPPAPDQAPPSSEASPALAPPEAESAPPEPVPAEGGPSPATAEAVSPGTSVQREAGPLDDEGAATDATAPTASSEELAASGTGAADTPAAAEDDDAVEREPVPNGSSGDHGDDVVLVEELS